MVLRTSLAKYLFFVFPLRQILHYFRFIYRIYRTNLSVSFLWTCIRSGTSFLLVLQESQIDHKSLVSWKIGKVSIFLPRKIYDVIARLANFTTPNRLRFLRFCKPCMAILLLKHHP